MCFKTYHAKCSQSVFYETFVPSSGNRGYSRNRTFHISRSLSTSRWMTEELGSRLERPIHFECKLNEPIHIGMRLLHPAAADHSMSIGRQQVHHIFSFSCCLRLDLVLVLTADRRGLLQAVARVV